VEGQARVEWIVEGKILEIKKMGVLSIASISIRIEITVAALMSQN